jgi:S-adenosylmethionine:tRNA-ribosyltransferase-isomerase (queuine synthetase)
MKNSKKIDNLEKLNSKYISRDVTPEDAERYQTIYAKERRSCSGTCRIALL